MGNNKDVAKDFIRRCYNLLSQEDVFGYFGDETAERVGEHGIRFVTEEGSIFISARNEPKGWTAKELEERIKQLDECEECLGTGWFLAGRFGSKHTPNGAVAVERCDACQRFESDEDAAVVAFQKGVRCRFIYPCVVHLGIRVPDSCPNCEHDLKKGIDLYYSHEGEGLSCLTYVYGPGLVLHPTSSFDDSLDDAKTRSARENFGEFHCPECDAHIPHKVIEDTPGDEPCFCAECGKKSFSGDNWYGDHDICEECMERGGDLGDDNE